MPRSNRLLPSPVLRHGGWVRATSGRKRILPADSNACAVTPLRWVPPLHRAGARDRRGTSRPWRDEPPRKSVKVVSRNQVVLGPPQVGRERSKGVQNLDAASHTRAHFERPPRAVQERKGLFKPAVNQCQVSANRCRHGAKRVVSVDCCRHGATRVVSANRPWRRLFQHRVTCVWVAACCCPPSS